MAVQTSPSSPLPKTDLRLSPKDKGLIRSMREKMVSDESQLKEEEMLKSSEDVARRVLSRYRKSITPQQRPRRTPGTGRYRTRSSSRRAGDTPPTSPPPISLSSPTEAAAAAAAVGVAPLPLTAATGTGGGGGVRKLGRELKTSLDDSAYKGNRRTPRNRKHPRDPADHRHRFNFSSSTRDTEERLFEEEFGGRQQQPAAKRQRFFGRLDSRKGRTTMPAPTNGFSNGGHLHQAPPPPPPNPPAFKPRRGGARTKVTVTQPNGITRIVSELAAAESAAAAAAAAALSDTGSSTSSMSPMQTPTLAAAAGPGGAPPPPPMSMGGRGMSQADWYKSSGRYLEQQRATNSASQSPALGPVLRRSTRASPYQGPISTSTSSSSSSSRRITRRLTDHRSPHYDPSVTLLPGNPPELSLNGSRQQQQPSSSSSSTSVSSSGRPSRKRSAALPPSGPSGNTRSAAGRNKRARTGSGSAGRRSAAGSRRGPSASPFGGGGGQTAAGYSLRHKPHRQNRNVVREFHTLSSSPRPAQVQSKHQARSDVSPADAEADVREIMMRRQRLRDYARAAPTTRFSELSLGKADYSELLMPSVCVVSPPNSRTRVLSIRKHPRDKFGTHEQVHVTDVVGQRKWVALIVGMNQKQVELLDENNKRCKIHIKDIERDRYVVTRPPPQHSRAPGHHTHHPSASVRQRSFR